MRRRPQAWPHLGARASSASALVASPPATAAAGLSRSRRRHRGAARVSTAGDAAAAAELPRVTGGLGGGAAPEWPVDNFIQELQTFSRAYLRRSVEDLLAVPPPGVSPRSEWQPPPPGFGALSRVKTASVDFPAEGREVTCVVCLEAPAKGETLRRLRCLHTFHPWCIDRWCLSHETCPLCKMPIVEEPSGWADGEGAPHGTDSGSQTPFRWTDGFTRWREPMARAQLSGSSSLPQIRQQTR